MTRNVGTDRQVEAFAPYRDWARILLPETAAGDPSHDVAHLARVHANAMRIQAEEGGDAELLAVAALLHDSVNIEKNDPRRPMASRLSAIRATTLMRPYWQAPRLAQLAHAIEAHSFSANIAPLTLEARILQDADRLDQIGALGVARAFQVGGRIGRSLYDPADPRALDRPLDEVAYTLDHFRTKLLGLAGGFQTGTGRAMAERLTARTREFLDWFEEEIGLAPLTPSAAPSPP